jgi:ATP-dependent DNA ligase
MLTQQPVPMLAQLDARLPTGESWLYEPKLDGFRGLLWYRNRAVAELVSRNGRDLRPLFPELIQAGRTLPPCTLIDGEIIIADSNGYVDFGALQARLSLARAHASRTVLQRPAVLIAFDILQVASCDLTEKPFVARREQLEHLLSHDLHACLQLIEQTADADLARDWLTLLPMVEGVVAKRADGRYVPGRRREWIKVKRYRTADWVVIGIAGDDSAPKLVLGLRHGDGLVHHLF